MNIIEASRTGKPMRRPCMGERWITSTRQSRAGDLCANDWEVKEELRVEVTLAQLISAWKESLADWEKLCRQAGHEVNRLPCPLPILKGMRSRLGLGG